MNTLLILRYSDASNHKRSMDFILDGEITKEQIQIIADKLENGESIIAEQLGLPTVSEELADEGYNFPTEDDHVWTDIGQFADCETGSVPSVEDMLTDELPTLENYSIDDFMKIISEIESWDEASEVERLGIPA